MTEKQWLACTNPLKMMRFLWGRSSDRKFRLFTCASSRWDYPPGCRSKPRWHRPPDERLLAAVTLAEQWAEDGERPPGASEHARWLVVMEDAYCAATEAIQASYRSSGLHVAFQVQLVRCIFGNPFRPSLPPPPAVLAWNNGVVRRLAQSAYDERELPSGHLDAARLAVLADALEEAGCTDADLLGHLRGPAPHLRGCWALDMLLGKQ